MPLTFAEQSVDSNFAHIYNIPDVWECQEGAFKCTSGRPTCINSKLLCDSEKYLHCHDGSDEKSCGMYTKPCFHTNMTYTYKGLMPSKTLLAGF